MTGPGKHSDAKHQPRGDRTAVERVSDPYRAREKWPEPTVCPQCRATFHRGRWQWDAAVANAEEHLCPACQRIRDRVPAAQLSLGGEFFKAHREEVLHRVRNVETKERAEHPLERIMEINDVDDSVLITYTDTHLAHGTGEALRHAYHGELDSHWTDEDGLLRISWKR